jgi:hypothetical protein
MTASRPLAARIRLLGSVLIASVTAAAAVAALLPAAGHTSDEPNAAAASTSVMFRPCFGAAARSPIAPCVDPSLRLTVFPTPDDALLEPNAPCQPQPRASLVNPCTFGASGSAEPASFALIGDSHASHWRAAVDVVARAAGSRAVSITRSGCPFSKARVVIPSRNQAATCRRWNREVLAWLGRHDEVTTVFLSQRANANYVFDGAASNFDTAIRGDTALFRALPPSVRSIVVIRDTPLSSSMADDCVRRGVARQQAVGMRCARARFKALSRDPAVTAARRLRGRAHVLDMTPFFCSSSVCYPVVGGALVHKDADHITTVFSRTLGPFMVSHVMSIVKDADRDAERLAARAAGR